MGRWNAWDVKKFGTQNQDCSPKPENGEPRAEGDGRGEVGPGDFPARRNPSFFGGRGVVWLGPQRKTKVRLRAGRPLGAGGGVICQPPHPACFSRWPSK